MGSTYLLVEKSIVINRATFLLLLKRLCHDRLVHFVHSELTQQDGRGTKTANLM